jgi:hypothetical protein
MSPPDSDKKRRSGRDRASKSGKKQSPPKPARVHGHEVIEDGRELYSPWLPLIWMLIPLFACVFYGLATR